MKHQTIYSILYKVSFQTCESNYHFPPKHLFFKQKFQVVSIFSKTTYHNFKIYIIFLPSLSFISEAPQCFNHVLLNQKPLELIFPVFSHLSNGKEQHKYIEVNVLLATYRITDHLCVHICVSMCI